MCKCTARIKMLYSPISNMINSYWRTYSSSHCYSRDDEYRFRHFDQQESHQHWLLNQSSEYIASQTNIELTIELIGFMESVMVTRFEAGEKMTFPLEMIKCLREKFTSYSKIYWVKAKPTFK